MQRAKEKEHFNSLKEDDKAKAAMQTFQRSADIAPSEAENEETQSSLEERDRPERELRVQPFDFTRKLKTLVANFP